MQRLRTAYDTFRVHRARVHNTWTLAAMENAFLADIGISRAEIHFPARASRQVHSRAAG